jgi:hypothetical protein
MGKYGKEGHLMARIANSTLMSAGGASLSAAQRRRALAKVAKVASSNPLRRVRLACHGWVRDSSAVVGDWLWCEGCADLRQVAELKE